MARPYPAFRTFMPSVGDSSNIQPVRRFEPNRYSYVSQQNLYGNLLIGVLYIVIFGGIISVIWALIYRVVGPPRYGPLDAEPIKSKRYKPQR